MQRILLITYFFPPSGGPAVQRNLKLVKYLCKFGNEATVLTADRTSYRVFDEMLINEIPNEAQVYRCKFNDYNRLFGKNIVLNKLLALLNIIMNIPDNKLLWNIKCKKYLDKIIFENNIDTVIISIAPYSSALLGRYIKKKYNKKVIIDYRDPWVHSPLQKFLPFYKYINMKLERSCLESTDGIISVSQPIIDRIVKEYNYKKKTAVIPNGYDNEAILENNIVNNNKFTITFIGNFSAKNNCKTLIEGIDKAILEGKVDRDKIKLIFVGNNQSYSTRQYIECTGYIPHKDVFNYTKNTDMLFIPLNAQNNKGTYSGKIFEYIVSNKPILALVPKHGVAADLIRKTNTGFIAQEDDIDDIKNTFIKVYNMWENKTLKIEPKKDEIEKYSRSELTKKLLRFIEEC